MPAFLARLPELRAWGFNVLVCCAGLALFVLACVEAFADAGTVPWAMCVVGVVLTVVISRFPIVIDRGDGGGIEIGFDSSILMFMLCTLDLPEALVVWSCGVLATQVISDRRLSSKLFNIGVGILAGFLAGLVLVEVRGDSIGTPRELAAVALAAAAYFLADLVLSAVSVAISTSTGLGQHLLQRQMLLALACFVPFDTLGYLGAMVYRSQPWWTVMLLGGPLATLLVATKAVTRGSEHARRLTVLFDAALRAQTLSDRNQIEEALVADARRLLRLPEVALHSSPPGRGEIGAPVQRRGMPSWVVAKAKERARSTIGADEQALRALTAVASDAFARLELIDEMVHIARHDPLTDLPNRGILLDRVTDALARGRGHEAPVALLFIDLDGFKPVNDRFGHAAGDQLLVSLAGRLRALVGGAGTVARLGGDEFAVLFEDLGHDDVVGVCERVLEAIQQEVSIAGHRISLRGSAGLAVAAPGDSAAGLLRNADLAMYVSKEEGRGRLVEYDASIGRARLERLELVDDLRGAIERSEIEVVYQPVLLVDERRIVGAEALARWNRRGRPVPPDVFIKAAEEAGLIVQLGDVVLRKVVADSVRLREAVDGPFSMAINVSARQLAEPGFVRSIEQATAEAAGVTLILEITEREGIDVHERMLDAMHAIRAAGVEFAVDDFGVGFSSISYLHDLPVQVIKADSSLSQGIDTDERAWALLRSVIAMGHTLGLAVVVEGIERESQLELLSGVDGPGLCAQGYLMYRPMPAEQLIATVVADRQDADDRVG
ncbi:MAG TPA: EAL domain-containing protein [Nocardioides sp.]|uniref:putative bifunctional diguanylate cyclase/phosphodiesterase n=1 Tax=Nocardioides sp. TaxID=35761 RepID=UPI002ED883F1